MNYQLMIFRYYINSTHLSFTLKTQFDQISIKSNCPSNYITLHEQVLIKLLVFRAHTNVCTPNKKHIIKILSKFVEIIFKGIGFIFLTMGIGKFTKISVQIDSYLAVIHNHNR